jgi:phage shock protein PspC (stress-responsive transcriptional regulator)
MNKTININLSGIIFYLDEEAYNLFNRYLIQVKNELESQEGGEEIIADIEARIAELFTIRLEKSRHQVITIHDINFICDTLGSPKEFMGEEEQSNEAHLNEVKSKKRLFRNPDEKVIGGVSSGIAAYFGTNMILIRIIFLLFLPFTGIGILLYVILWAAIPEAKTTAQKLQMKGEPVNLSNIKKSVTDELEGVKERFGQFGKNSSAKNNSFIIFLNRIASFILQVIEVVLKFIFNFIKIVLIIVASITGFVLFMILFGTIAETWNISGLNVISINGNLLGLNIAQAMLGNGIDLKLLQAGTLLILLFPILVLITLVAKALGRPLTKAKLFNVIGGISFLIGLAFIVYKVGQVATSFRVKATEMKKIQLSGRVFDIRADILERNEGFLFELNDDRLRIENIELQIKESKDSTASLILKHRAKGKSNSFARQRARLFDYPIDQTGEILSLSEYFSVPKEALYRGQALKVTLYLPPGSEIFMDPSIENLIFNIENAHDMLDENMLGHTWKMTEDGLLCADCETIDYFSGSDVNGIMKDKEEKEESSGMQRKIKELESEIKRLKSE